MHAIQQVNECTVANIHTEKGVIKRINYTETQFTTDHFSDGFLVQYCDGIVHGPTSFPSSGTSTSGWGVVQHQLGNLCPPRKRCRPRLTSCKGSRKHFHQQQLLYITTIVTLSPRCESEVCNPEQDIKCSVQLSIRYFHPWQWRNLCSPHE